ncbi:MATE family efflux transporter [Sandaracinus amylolyticus]|uniref:Multidrug-efflux transporter n=1 Tax=Sandaracinus amylolyticus TaxID=927083 RepID=A0A0F6W3B8_9BACT|nr:MATE family efflux transporter [Sandaracinus amylolyticus]AKF06215.1 Na+-driven multidrug efflux pump [Sandaracinus amylolyticus]
MRLDLDVARAVARLAGPAIAQSLLHTLVFLVDRAMLGRFSADALASMQISGPVTWSISSVASAVQVGALAVVGREVGAGRRDEAAAAVRAGLGASAGIGLLAGVAATLAIPLVLAGFPDAGPAVRDEARAYLGVILPCMPLLLVSAMAGAVFQSAGDTRTPLLVALLANAVNGGANWVLIFGRAGVPALGARGAAIGSVLALAVECAVLIALLARGRGVVSLRGRGGERAQLARMVRVAGPATLERIVQHAGFLVFVAMIGALGPLAMAANQALISIESVAFLSADGFGIAGAAMVAQRLGAGREDQARMAARVAAAMALVALSACGIVFVIAPRALASAFTPEPEIVALAVPCLFVAAIAQPFMAVGVVLGDALRGAGATRTTFVITLIGGVAVRLAATWLFAFELGLGLVGVWIGSTVDWATRTALASWRFSRPGWARAV